MVALAVNNQLRAGKPVLAEEEQEVDLPLDLDLALHLVDLEEIPTLRGVEAVVGVDRPFGDLARSGDPRKPVIRGYLVELPL